MAVTPLSASITVPTTLSMKKTNNLSALTVEGQIDPRSTSNLAFCYLSDVGVTQSAGKASKVADQSSNLIDLIQNTGAQQPAYNTNGAGGFPFLTFSKTTEMLSGTTAVMAGATGATLIMVMSSSDASSAGNYFGGVYIGTITTEVLDLRTSGGSAYAFYPGVATTVGSFNVGPTSLAALVSLGVVAVRYNGGTARGFRNNTQVNTGNETGALVSTTSQYVRVGRNGATGFSGDFYAMVGWSRWLPDGEFAAVCAWFANRYGALYTPIQQVKSTLTKITSESRSLVAALTAGMTKETSASRSVSAPISVSRSGVTGISRSVVAPSTLSRQSSTTMVRGISATPVSSVKKQATAVRSLSVPTSVSTSKVTPFARSVIATPMLSVGKLTSLSQSIFAPISASGGRLHSFSVSVVVPIAVSVAKVTGMSRSIIKTAILSISRALLGKLHARGTTTDFSGHILATDDFSGHRMTITDGGE